MGTLSNKIIGIVGTAMVFAGMSFGQTFTCAANTVGTNPSPILDRFEDTTALVADLTIGTVGTPCNDSAAAVTNVVVTLNEPVTSKVVTAATGLTEATLLLTDTTTAANSQIVQGTIAGNTVTFLNVQFPAATDSYTLRIANIRVNASLAPNGSSNFAITEGLFITNQGQAVYATPAPVTVGFVVQGFLAPKGSGIVTNYAICTANPVSSVIGTPAAASFSVTVGENFAGAFKSQAPIGVGGTGLCGGAACPVTNGDGGSLLAAPGGYTGHGVVAVGTGLATHGDRFAFSFANVPTGVTIYLPINAANNNVTTGSDVVATLTSGVTGAFAAVTPAPAKTSGILTANTFAAYTATGGTVTAVYEIMSTDDTFTGETFTATGAITAAANFSTSALPAITVTVTPAPSSGTDIPTFAASTNAPITLASFSLCQTTLLFPFITNQQGYDTGIAISNTGADPLGVVGATSAGTTGSCNLNFYGAGGALTTTTLVATPTGFGTASGLAPGSTGSFLLSGTDGGFQGYMIAQCNFLYGHGYAFIFNGLIGTSPNAIAEGYLAEVLANNRSGAVVLAGPEFVTF